MENIISTEELSNAIKSVSQMNISRQSRIADEIFRHQPYFLGTLMSMKSSINDMNQFGLLLIIMIVIWESVKNFPQIKSKKIIEDLFEEMADKNESFLKYYDGEECAEEQERLIDIQFEQ